MTVVAPNLYGYKYIPLDELVTMQNWREHVFTKTVCVPIENSYIMNWLRNFFVENC